MVRHCANRKAEVAVENHQISLAEYVQKILDAYRQTPGTAGIIRRPDRLLAAQLYHRGVPFASVENALILATARRLIRPADAPQLNTIRSMAYFSPVIEEVLELHTSPAYFQHLRHKLQRFYTAPHSL
jgi:hypothetical protein